MVAALLVHSGAATAQDSVALPESSTPSATRPAAPSTTVQPGRARDIRVRPRRPPATRADEPTRIDGDTVRGQHRDLSDALSVQPNLTVERVGGFGSSTVIRVRGATPAQTTWAIDGIPLGSPIGQPFDVESLPLGLLRSALIHATGAPLSLGPQAMGGAIDLQLRGAGDPRARVGLGSFNASFVEGLVGWSADEAPGNGAAGGGTAETRHQRLLGPGVLGVRWLSATNNFHYRNDAGTPLLPADDHQSVRANNDVQRFGLVFAQTLHLSDATSVRGRWLLDQREQGVPGSASNPALQARLDHHRNDLALQLHHEGRLGVSEAVVRGAFQRQVVDDRGGELAAKRARTVDVDAIEASGRWQGKPRAGWQPNVRALGRYGRVDGVDAASARRQPTSTLLGGELDVAAPWQSESRLVRLEPRLGIATARSERADDPAFSGAWQRKVVPWRALPTARMALALQPHPRLRWIVGTTYARRAPNLLELFGDDGVIRGNATLRDERAAGLDTAVNTALGFGPLSVQAQLGASWRTHTDLITLVRASPTTSVWQNVASANIAAADGSLTALAFGRVQLQLSGQLMRARDTSADPAYAGRALPLLPASRGSARAALLDVQAGPVAIAPWCGLRWRAGRFADRANLVVLPSRTRLDLGIGLGWNGLQLDARVDNVLGAGDDDLVGFPLPGRAFLVTLSVDTAAPDPAVGEGNR